MRIAAATLMLEDGADISFIRALLDHQGLEMTQIYTHVSFAKLPPITEGMAISLEDAAVPEAAIKVARGQLNFVDVEIVRQ